MSPRESSSGPGVDEVLGQIRELLGEVLGADYLEAIPVEQATTFMGDLEMQSVEFVAFAEALHEKFPDVDLVEWVADMPSEDLPSLTVGQLAGLLAWHRSDASAGEHGGAM